MHYCYKKLLRCAILLQEFDQEIRDKKVVENFVVDPLSRLEIFKVTKREGTIASKFLDEKSFAVF